MSRFRCRINVSRRECFRKCPESARYGETIQSYLQRPDLDVKSLTFIPLVIAAWLRYLLAINDCGEPMECSSDPMLASLQQQLQGVVFGDPESLRNQADPILSNKLIFGSDLIEIGMGENIQEDYRKMLEGPGAVRRTLQDCLKN